jgi:type II secretory pathway pseudopilin PulG
MFIVIFHISQNVRRATAAFTMAETIVALGVIGIGVACTIGGLTKMNAIASSERNLTGAYAVLTSKVDQFQSLSPFNPWQSNSNPDPCGTPRPFQIPQDTCNGSYPLYDMTTGTAKTLGYYDPMTGNVKSTWPIYMEPPRWTYANAGARTGASGFRPTDVGQLAYQSDAKTYWRLQSTVPTWTQDTSAGIPISATVTETVTALTSSFATTTNGSPTTAYHQAVFTITFTYLGKPYTLSMSTIRASDS